MGRKRFLITIVTIIILIFVTFLFGVLYNIVTAKYELIEDDDKVILSEIDQYCKANEKKKYGQILICIKNIFSCRW